MPHKIRQHEKNTRIVMETKIVQNLIQCYFDIVKKNIGDVVPKTIMAFLINESKKIC